MRVSFLLLSLLCLYATAQCQAPADAVAPEDAAFNALYANRNIPKVTGRLLNITAEELKGLTITYTIITPFPEVQLAKTVSAQPDGRFSLQLDYPFPNQQIWLAVGDIFFAGIYADKDLFVQLDMKKIKPAKKVFYNGDGVRYSGTDGPLNVFLNNYLLYKKEEQQRISAKIDALVFSSNAPIDSILPMFNTLFDSVKLLEDSYVAANPSPYSWMLENERMSDYCGDLCLKYMGKKMDDAFWQKIKLHKSYLISNSSTEFYRYMMFYVKAMPRPWPHTTWKDVAALPDLDARENALVDSLKESEKAQPAYPCSPDDIKKWQAMLKPRIQKIAQWRSLNKNISLTDSAFNPAKADFLKLGLGTSKDPSEQQREWQLILGSMHTPWCTQVAKSEYTRTAQKIAAINNTLATSATYADNTSFGRPVIKTAFGASLYKAPSIKALDFLAKLKQSFPGKAIIIDRWATWCAPCLSEMPHSKDLELASKNLPVVFVYLCTLNESSEDKWKSKVIELQQPGVHILIDEALDADLSKYFSFSGYPGYALIDKAGNYKPGAITRMFFIKDSEALAAIVNN